MFMDSLWHWLPLQLTASSELSGQWATPSHHRVSLTHGPASHWNSPCWHSEYTHQAKHVWWVIIGEQAMICHTAVDTHMYQSSLESINQQLLEWLAVRVRGMYKPHVSLRFPWKASKHSMAMGWWHNSDWWMHLSCPPQYRKSLGHSTHNNPTSCQWYQENVSWEEI